MESIVCTINLVQYHDPESGFSIIKAVPEGSLGIITVRIKMLEPTPGMTIKAEGEWEKSKYGLQFVASEWEEELPKSLIGIEGYLSSGMIKGIGPIYAKKIVQTFGTDSFKILDEAPERLKEVPGIGDKRATEIAESWVKQQAIRNLMIFLKHYNIGTRLIIKIYRMFGDEAIGIIKDNPYRLTQIEGIGFKTADNIALNVGIEMDDPKRVKAGIMYKMAEMCEDGDTYCRLDDVTRHTGVMLEIDDEVVEDNVRVMLEEGTLVEDRFDCIYLKYLYDAEVNVADKLKSLATYCPMTRFSKITAEELEAKTGYHYEGNQLKAIETALEKNVMILTGGPGTGKTTVIKGIIELLSSMGLSIMCAAPTGKAAKRMSELTGRQASTIHRLLEYNPALGCTYGQYNPLPGDVLIVDEMSMVNLMLMDTLVRAIPRRMKFIMVGDIDQLPCIGSGNVLRDCIDSGVLPVVKLDKIFRQAEGSNIIWNAHNVKDGYDIVVSNKPDSDFFFLKRDDDILAETVDLVVNRLPAKYNCKPVDIQVLTPMKKCSVGVDSLNVELQKAINPVGTEVKYGKHVFRVGDKVIQTVNNYDKEVFNGDSGFIDSIYLEQKIVYVRFDERVVEYTYPDLEELSLAYAMTIHKSQGSEYPIVVIPITYANKIMMQRNLIYTAITRAKNICVIIGQRRMIDIGIANAVSYKRKTLLKERLRTSEGMPEEDKMEAQPTMPDVHQIADVHYL